MSTDTEHSIPFSRNKLLSSIRMNVFSIIIFGFFLWRFTVKPIESSALYQLFAIPLILILLVSLIPLIRKLYEKFPGLVVNSKGIVDNTSFFPATFIGWDDIVRIFPKQVRSVRWLIIEVYDPEQYFFRDNFFVYTFQKINHFLAGSSLFLTANFIEIDFDEMTKLISENYKKYGRK